VSRVPGGRAHGRPGRPFPRISAPCDRVLRPSPPSPLTEPRSRTTRPDGGESPKLSAELEEWLSSGGDATLDGLVTVFGAKSFALVFVLLLGVPALPLPTGGATHVFELIAVVVALELVAGRDRIWLPRRWSRVDLGGRRRRRLLGSLLRLIRGLERVSRPRLRFLFAHRVSNGVFGLLVAGGSIAAFLAPPFSGLDTLPALGVVLVSIGVLLEDIAIVVLGLLTGAAGIALEIALGAAALRGLGSLL
jgi:hypothetical protein